MQKERYYEYDVVRIILTILVVIGHAIPISISTWLGGIEYDKLTIAAGYSVAQIQNILETVSKWIYSFHMPAFFVLSGALFARHINDTFKTVLKSRAKRLLIPYAVFGVYSIVIKLLSGTYTNISFLGLLQATFIPIRTHMWFVLCLFVVILIVRGIERHVSNNIVKVAIFVVMYITGITIGYILPFGNPLKYALWFWIGLKLFEPKTGKIIELIRKNKTIVFLPVSILVHAVSFVLFVMTGMDNECNPIASLAGTIAVFAISVAVCKIMSDAAKRRAANISDMCFGIYLLSDPLNYPIQAAAYAVFGAPLYAESAGVAALFVVRSIFTGGISAALTASWKNIKKGKQKK